MHVERAAVSVLCMLACLLVCVADGSVAVLPCGTPQLLTPQNATNTTIVVTNCWQSKTTEVLLRGNEDGVVVENVTLLASHSVHVRVVIDGVRLVNSTVSLFNVSYPSDCSACAAGSAVRLRNASIEGSTVAVSGALMHHDAGTALLSIGASNITRSLLAVRASTVDTAAVIESSAIVDSNVTLQGVAAHTHSSIAAVLLLGATFMRSHITAVNCTFESNTTGADHGGAVTSFVAINNCTLHHTALLLQNVSALVVGLNMSSTSRQRLLSVERSTVTTSSVTLTDVDSACVGMFGSTGSVWAANSSVVLDVFRVQSLVAAMPCAAAFEASTLHGALVLLSAGAVSLQTNGSAALLCVSDCRVDATVLSVRQLTVVEELAGVSVPSSDTRGVFNLMHSRLSSAALHLSDIHVNSTSATALVLFFVQSADSSITVTGCVMATARGVRIQHSELYATQLHFTALEMSAALTAWEMLSCSAVDITALLTDCTLRSRTSNAWLIVASNVTACNITLQHTWLSAASNTFQVQETTLTTANVALLNSNVSAVTSWGLRLLASNVSSGSIAVVDTWLGAESNTFVVFQSALTGVHVIVVNSNVSAATLVAWAILSSNMTAGEIFLYRTSLSAASNTFQMLQTMLIAANITLRDSHVSALGSVAWVLLSSTVTTCSIALLLTCVAAAGNTLRVSQTALTAVTMTMVDSNVSATASVAWALFSSDLTDCSIYLQHTQLSATSNTLQVQQMALTAVNISLVDSSLSATVSVALFLLASEVKRGSMLLQRTQLSATSNAFQVQQMAVVDVNVTLVDSSVSAVLSAACVLLSSNVTAGSIMLHLTILAATSNTFRISQTALTAVHVTLVYSNVSATSTGAFLLSLCNVTACMIVLDRTLLSAASNAFVVQQQTVVAATSVTLLDSNISAAVSWAMLISSSNVTAVGIFVRRATLSAASNTFVVQQTALTAVNMTLMDSNVSAVTSWGWFLLASNVTASSFFLQRTWLSARTYTFVIQETVLTATDVTMVDNYVFVTTSWAWVLLASNVTASSIVVLRTRISGASNTFRVLQSALTAVDMTLVDSNVSAAASWAWVLSSSTVSAAAIAVRRTVLSAASSTFVVQQTTLTAVTMTMVDSSVSAVGSWAWVVLQSNVTGASSIVLQRTFLGSVGFTVGLRNTVVAGLHIAVLSCSLLCASASGDELSGAAAVRVATSSIANSTLLLRGGSIDIGEGGSVLRVVNSSVMMWSLRIAHTRVSAGSSVSDPSMRHGEDFESAAAMVAIAHSAAADVDIIVRFSSVVGLGTFLLCNDSKMELETLVIASSNISTHDGQFAHARLVRATGSTPAYIHNVSVERNRFAGFTELFGASGASSLSVGDSAYRCSWWSFTAATPRWRPLTKLHLGMATFERLPAFGSGASDGDSSAACGIVTVSVSESGTASALELSGSRSMLLSSSETLALTASGGTASCSRSGTTTAEATHTPIVAQRVVQIVVDSNVGSAALIGAAIAATSFSTVRAGLTGQRIAFVLRSAGRLCAALDNGNTVLVIGDVDWLSSPTRLLVGRGAAAAHRGAVLGNIAVCVGASLLAAAVVGCVVLSRGLRATAAMTTMHVRHVLCVPVMLLLEPTFASSVTLLMDRDGTAADVAVGAAGVVCVGSALLGVAHVLDPRTSRFRARTEALPHEAPVVPLSASQLISGAWRWWTAACVVWRPKAGSGRFVLEWGFLFDDSRGERHWWALVDMGISVVMGGLSSALPATSSSCAVWKWAIVAVACGGVVLPLVLVPLSSPRAMCECVTMAALTALIAVLGAADAGDAAVEGIGILAAVLQWAWILLEAVTPQVCALRVRHVAGEGLGTRGDFTAVHVRSGAVEALTMCHHDNVGGINTPPPLLVRTVGIFYRPQSSGRLSLPRAPSRMRLQAAALQALVRLICCHRKQKENA